MNLNLSPHWYECNIGVNVMTILAHSAGPAGEARRSGSVGAVHRAAGRTVISDSTQGTHFCTAHITFVPSAAIAMRCTMRSVLSPSPHRDPLRHRFLHKLRLPKPFPGPNSASGRLGHQTSTRLMELRSPHAHSRTSTMM